MAVMPLHVWAVDLLLGCGSVEAGACQCCLTVILRAAVGRCGCESMSNACGMEINATAAT